MPLQSGSLTSVPKHSSEVSQLSHQAIKLAGEAKHDAQLASQALYDMEHTKNLAQSEVDAFALSALKKKLAADQAALGSLQHNPMAMRLHIGTREILIGVGVLALLVGLWYLNKRGPGFYASPLDDFLP